MIPGSKNTIDPYAIPAQLRQDYLRTGVLGGVGEGIWVAGECEMCVDGSIAPVTFSYGPPAGEDWLVKNLLAGYICGVAATAIEFGTLGVALPNGITFQLANSVPAVSGLAVLNVNGDFMKIGTPMWSAAGLGSACILTTWTPDFPIMLRGNAGEVIRMTIRDDLTAVGAGTTLWAQVRGLKYVG